MKTILAIDTDIVVYNRETAEWMEHGINSLRIDTMTEAINILVNRSDFLYIAINEDTIPGFMSQLHIMRDVTYLPIFVITSNYTIEKKIKAMNCGADVYDHFNAYIKNNVIDALALLEARKKRRKSTPKHLRVLTGGDIILSPFYRKVFIRDIKVSLTKKEFDILQFLMDENSHVVTHSRLIRKIWGNKRDFKDTSILWQTIERLRKKLSEISPTNEYIEVERGVGYRFAPSPDIQWSILNSAVRHIDGVTDRWDG